LLSPHHIPILECKRKNGIYAESKRKYKMSSERAVLAFAGFMVLLSVVLTLFVHPAFFWLTVFVGANLFQSAFTGFCPAAKFFQKLGFKSSESGCC